MKCICRQNSQVHREEDGHIVTYTLGDIADFKKCPATFDKLGAKPIDFATATDNELMRTKWSFDDAAAFVLAEYDVELIREDGDKKRVIVDRILDAKFRQVNDGDLQG